VRSFPRSRVTGETVRAVVARILIEEVKDPRVELLTVTGVAMSPDRRHANVFVIGHGGPDRYKEALAGLESARGRIRKSLGEAVRMKFVPDLHFMIDPSVDEAEHITGIILSEIAAGRVPVDRPEDEAEADTPGDE
jgi:ribosome-binding factor A